jgi:hypothetical protein
MKRDYKKKPDPTPEEEKGDEELKRKRETAEGDVDSVPSKKLKNTT